MVLSHQNSIVHEKPSVHFGSSSAQRSCLSAEHCRLEQGRWCAANAWLVLGISAAIIGVCALGLLRFRVETSPEHLWVGSASKAAKEKADYEVWWQLDGNDYGQDNTARVEQFAACCMTAGRLSEQEL